MSVASVMQKYGIPEFIWYPIMMLESGGNPGSHNPNGEDSRGLFQINIQANPQYRGLDLYNPDVNAEVAARDFLLPAYRKIASAPNMSAEDKTAYVWRYGIKPYWTSEKAAAIKSKTSEYLASGKSSYSIVSSQTPIFEGGTISNWNQTPWEKFKSWWNDFSGHDQPGSLDPREELQARKNVESIAKEKGIPMPESFTEGTKSLEGAIANSPIGDSTNIFRNIFSIVIGCVLFIVGIVLLGKTEVKEVITGGK